MSENKIILGAKVSLTIKPDLKGIITSYQMFLDGGEKYCVSYYDDGVRDGWFFESELIWENE